VTVQFLTGRATADLRGQYSRGRDVYRVAVRVLDIGSIIAIAAGIIVGIVAVSL